MIDAHGFKKRVEKLAERDRNRSLFGCELHKYKFGPCLQESELVQLESAYGIELPAEYRSYLTSIGNGGAGPGYGLVPLVPPVRPSPPSSRQMGVVLKNALGKIIHRRSYEDVSVNYDPTGAKNTSAAARPFPLVEPHRSITDEMWKVQIPNWDEKLRAENQTRRATFRALAFGDGVLKIADYGSGIYSVLVIQGPFRGQIWVTDPHMGDYVPASMRSDLHDRSVKVEKAYSRYQRGLSFVDWYDHWLSSAEAGLMDKSGTR
jgi:hypothetical protein